MRKRLAVYPGSFDTITNGHLDILTRGLELFDTVIVAIAHNIEKKALFTIEEKKDMIMRSVKDHLRVKVDSFEGLLVDYVKRVDAKTVIRGLRAMSDFEYEFQMASMNRELNRGMDTIFMMTSKDYFFISSRTIKEVASFGGSVAGLVPDIVQQKLKEKFKG
ncbi:MAG: pantetheine-phosphate adenylyltransferase [Syntrophorhabdus sp.]